MTRSESGIDTHHRNQAHVPLTDILETDWDATLFRGPNALANQLGWTTYHTLRSKGSRTGYPDRTCVRDRILFAELKREKTQPTPDQVAWLDRLAGAGGEVYLWRPSDLEEIARILGKRWHYWSTARALSENNVTAWKPRSLWIPGHGRADTQASLPGKEAA